MCLNLRPSVHWNATGEIFFGCQYVSSVLQVVFRWPSFQWCSSVFQIMQINTGSPLGHHWNLALADVVAVASQCTCGSSGLPVWSVQWYPSVLTKSVLEVTGSGHYSAACNHLCIQLVWWELFELNWSHLNCHPQYTKNIMMLISKACTEWCWSTHMFKEQDWYPLQSSKLQVKAEFTETCPLAGWFPFILSFQTGMGATLLYYMCLVVCGLLQSLQWCSRVGCKS